MSDHPPAAGALRLPAVDGLRGLLALVVLAFHLTEPFGAVLAKPANIAVSGFFILSGYVLARGWEDRYAFFLARRFLRLWPVYALCLAYGYWRLGAYPVWSQFVWYPIGSANTGNFADPPIWSLRIEAWAMPFMPLFVWAGRGGALRIAFGLAAIALASLLSIHFAFGFFFLTGAAASRWPLRSRFLESPIPQWIGKISYSLYLTHWLVFETASSAFGPLGRIASLPVAFAVGWLVWYFVERPSIALSRHVALLTPPRNHSHSIVPGGFEVTS